MSYDEKIERAAESFDPDELIELATDEHPGIRSIVALRSDLDPEFFGVLAGILAADSEFEVLHSLSLNTETPGDVLYYLSRGISSLPWSANRELKKCCKKTLDRKLKNFGL